MKVKTINLISIPKYKAAMATRNKALAKKKPLNSLDASVNQKPFTAEEATAAIEKILNNTESDTAKVIALEESLKKVGFEIHYHYQQADKEMRYSTDNLKRIFDIAPQLEKILSENTKTVNRV